MLFSCQIIDTGTDWKERMDQLKLLGALLNAKTRLLLQKKKLCIVCATQQL